MYFYFIGVSVSYGIGKLIEYMQLGYLKGKVLEFWSL